MEQNIQNNVNQTYATVKDSVSKMQSTYNETANSLQQSANSISSLADSMLSTVTTTASALSTMADATIQQANEQSKALIDSAESKIKGIRNGVQDYSKQIDAQKTLAEINKAKQKLAKIPEQTIANIQKAIQKLTTAINGWEDTSSPSVDPDAIIDSVTALLDPVVQTLTSIISSIGLPSIPGLTEISELLSSLSSMKPSEHQEAGKLPELPQDLLQTLTDLLAALQSLCATLPMVCVNILFNTVDLILSTGIPVVGMNFYDIIGMVPYVQEIPELVSVAPKIVDVVSNVPGKIGTAVTAKLKQQLKAINDLQVPKPPANIDVSKQYNASVQKIDDINLKISKQDIA